MRRLRLALAAVTAAALLLVPNAGVTATGAQTESVSGTGITAAAAVRPVRAVFYYPWFPQTWHDDDQYTPSRGRYSNDSAEVLDAQFEDMAYAGLDLAISSWWGHGTVTGNRLERVMKAGEAHGVSVVPYYEKEHGDQDPTVAELRSDLAGLEPLTSRPGWLHVDGKPVIFVYNSGATGCSDVSRWRQATDGWTDFYVNLKVFPGFADCADQPQSWHQYGPSTSRSEHLPWSSNVSPGFWKHGEAEPRLVRDLARFEADLRAQVASGAQWQLVTSYSEWGEGTAVESAVEWRSQSGRGKYLDVMRKVHLGTGDGGAGTVGRAGLRVPASVDAHVSAAEPRANFGNARSLAIDRSPLKRSYLRFRVPEPAERAWLRLWSPRGNRNGIAVRSTSSQWREGSITYRNAPDPGTLRGRTGAVRAGAWTSVDVTAALRRAGSHSFVVTSRGGKAAFNSTEHDRRRPHLVVQPAAGDDEEVVVWAAGDLCDDHDQPECADVGAMIAADRATDHFLALGDLQYEEGELVNFRRYYDPALGSGPGLKSRTLPVPGNHEYLTEGASGYFDYFGALAGDRSKGYYSRKLGAWRLIVSNTSCGEVGGCDPSDPQGVWLQERLATSPQCTVVAGHHPAITDGTYAPDTDAGRQMLDYAFDGRAELYLAGHDHEYQRFPRLDKELRPDDNRGVRTFVVGTGGKNLTEWGSTNRSEYRQNTQEGALRLELRPGSYTWEFRSVSGTVMDRGSGTCS